MREQKDSCLLYRSIVDAAKELEPEEALELLLVWADYALGDTDKINTDNKYIRLILSQVVPSLDAAERRYAAAVENGKKGADFGKLGGRPRKNPSKTPVDTPELSPEKPQKNPRTKPENVVGVSDEKTPVKPQTKPQDVDVDVSVDVSLDIINNNINNTKDTQVLPKVANTIEENSPGEREQKCFTEKDRDTIQKLYYQINVDKVLENLKKCSSDDQFYSGSVLDFINYQDNFEVLTSCIDYWNSGGVEKFLELTSNLSWSDRGDVLSYVKVARQHQKELLSVATPALA